MRGNKKFMSGWDDFIMNAKISQMELFYKKLLSSVWSERLDAYEKIASDLKQRGCSIFNEDRWVDVKLLIGQIISIHFKKHVSSCVREFDEKLQRLYSLLLAPLRSDESSGHEDSMQLLIDIYDDDDEAARREIRRFFKSRANDGGLNENESVLENLFRCYARMMQRVRERGASFFATEAVPA